jgi:hypothetical protein
MKTIVNNRKMKDTRSLGDEKQFLVDYVRSCSDKYGRGFAEQLRHVERALHEKVSSLKQMIIDAKDLKAKNCSTNGLVNIERIVNSFSRTELPPVRKYMQAIVEYLEGKPFDDTVYEALGGIINLKPIPDTIYAPPGTFSKELIEAYEIV